MKKLLNIFVAFLFLLCITPINANAKEVATVIADWAALRKSASSSSAVVTDSVGKINLLHGTRVTILSESGSFYKVDIGNGVTGYIAKSMVFKDSELTLEDEAYCAEMVNLGFDKSYCPYLSYLHSKHPNWIFKPLVTNLKFEDVVEGEEGKNYIQLKTYREQYTSSDKVREGSNWYTANQKVVSYMLDPRNFLNEKSIFMFEYLGYDPKVDSAELTKDVVTTIAGSTHLKKYIDVYMNAGETYSVSPVHLISRSVQEGASKSTYAAVNGTEKFTCDGEVRSGYYNFYNIGANKSVYDGLCYASEGTTHLRKWTTPELAIKGGASFIASGYVSKGQNTLYFQKFQTNPNAKYALFTHQYMTNILAPYSEGNNVINNLKKVKLENNTYTFNIPVYTNMPAKTYQASLLSVNNYLTDITVDGKSIAGFDSDVVEYNVSVLDTVSKISLDAKASEDVKIEGTGEIELANEKTSVQLKVTSQSGEVRVYNLTINKVKNIVSIDDIVDKLDVKVDKEYFYDISSDETTTSFTKKVKASSPNAEVTYKKADGSEQEGALSTGDKVTIKVDTTEKVFVVAIHGDVNGNDGITIVDLLRLQKYLLGSIKLEKEFKYAGDVNSDGEVDIRDLLRLQKHLLGTIKL